ncbi:Gfo/Idh/MocA family oxidoreductase [Campylobacter jejuni]|uniref:Gfo/Idh/MocA family oxidoreductase n=1 Tax=Campylobacter jejuni TaxID=197 RepID=UPI0020280DFD|nr:Gfo/Idh/MocA family oxidoreductase [Campylobacter jejuni]
MIKIGIAGFGKIGQLRAKKILEKNYAQVVAVYDIKKPLNLGSDIIFCYSFDELLSQDIDAIFICTFVDSLAEYTKKALLAKKHVFSKSLLLKQARSFKRLLRLNRIVK